MPIGSVDALAVDGDIEEPGRHLEPQPKVAALPAILVVRVMEHSPRGVGGVGGADLTVPVPAGSAIPSSEGAILGVCVAVRIGVAAVPQDTDVQQVVFHVSVVPVRRNVSLGSWVIGRPVVASVAAGPAVVRIVAGRPSGVLGGIDAVALRLDFKLDMATFPHAD